MYTKLLLITSILLSSHVCHSQIVGIQRKETIAVLGKNELLNASKALKQHQYKRAIKHCKVALNAFQRVKDDQSIANTYYILGTVYHSQGILHKSQTYYLAILHKLSDKSPLVAFTHNALGLLYLHKFPKKAIKHITKIVDQPFLDKVTIYNNLTILYAQVQQPDKAISYGQKALQIFRIRSNNQSKPHHLTPNVSHNLGLAYQQKGDYRNAIKYYKQSFDILKRHHIKRPKLYCYNHIKLGEVYRQIRQNLIAKQYLDSAIVANELQDKSIYLQAFTGKAQLLSQTKKVNPKHLTLALSYYYQCDSLIRSLQKARSYYDQLSFAAKTSDIYEAAFATCFQLYQQTRSGSAIQHAFYFMERAKGQVLWLERLKAHHGLNEAHNRVLLDSLANLRRTIAATKADSLKLALYATMAEVSYQIEKPTYGLDTLQSISGIRQKINSPSTAIITYFEALGNLYGLVVTKNRVALKHLGQTKVLRTKIHRFDTCVRKFACSPSELVPHGYQIYKQIMEPFDAILPKRGNLVIIPEKDLWQLPFAALSSNGQVSYQRLASNYLIDRYAIGYNYSVNLWGSRLASQVPSSNDYEHHFVGMAPGFQNNWCQAAGLAPLPHSLIEIDSSYAKYLKTNKAICLKGSQATLKNALQVFSQKNRIVQLATHSSDTTQFSPLPYIQFLPMSKGDLYASRLYLENIYHLRPQTQLVILSSCLSGSGHLHRTEGLLGLSRGFVQAGVPQVLFSPWNVADNQSTTRLMTIFHSNLTQSQNMSYANALQQAKKTVASQIGQHPSRWAGFMIITHCSSQ